MFPSQNCDKNLILLLMEQDLCFQILDSKTRLWFLLGRNQVVQPEEDQCEDLSHETTFNCFEGKGRSWRKTTRKRLAVQEWYGRTAPKQNRKKNCGRIQQQTIFCCSRCKRVILTNVKQVNYVQGIQRILVDFLLIGTPFLQYTS